MGAIYHTGVDVAVRDDKPESGAPAGRTHRVFAIEGGVVEEATAKGVRGNVRIGHFGYGHVDARVKKGDRVKAGQFIGWTTKGSWHVHLTEFFFPGDGRRLLINPLRPGGKLRPYVDTAPPIIHDVRFYTPATPTWGRRVTGVAQLPPAGTRLDKSRLTGIVDVRARVSDPQSFHRVLPRCPPARRAAPPVPDRAPAHRSAPANGSCCDARSTSPSRSRRSRSDSTTRPGRSRTIPPQPALRRRIQGAGEYWFRLFQKPYWNTTRVPNGRYLLVVRAWDAAGNRARSDIEIGIRNPPV